MAPLDLGDVGGAVAGAAETAVGGAKGAVETATSAGGGAAKTAAGAVATATNAVNDAKGKYDDAKGMLGMFTKMQDFITKGDKKKEKEDYHKCSLICLKTVPRSTRMELEKQHGDLRKGWFDSTYFARSCGRVELPEDPEERAKWHWYGHEDQRIHRMISGCVPSGNEEERLEKEYERRKKREKYWKNLTKGVDKLGENAGSWKKRVNKDWAKENDLKV
ncbi:hypothetical protein I204_03741 [Kwoniella mangroviensis CBS 8886]|nr:hypothetical protein I204_03741 [Kwoniella mangroviensis CBS 8886]